MATHEEFGELKANYSLPKNLSIRATYIPLMRANLIERNNKQAEIKLYPTSEIVDLKTCNLQKLYEADCTLNHYEIINKPSSRF